MSEKDGELLRDALCKNAVLFPPNNKPIGHSKITSHTIVTRIEEPKKVKPRAIAVRLYQAARKELREMLDAGIIEESTSNWGAPIKIVDKKNARRHQVLYRLQAAE